MKLLNYKCAKDQPINKCDLLVVKFVYLKLDNGFLQFHANMTKCEKQHYPTTSFQSVLQYITSLIRELHLLPVSKLPHILFDRF